MSRFHLREEPAGLAYLGRTEPPDWRSVFQATSALELEIGCGAGGFALEYCARNPHVGYVALEWRKKYAREVQHRARVRNLTNLVVIEGDARLEVPRLFGAGTLAAIHLHFPDPWWKRAHRKRAILTPDFTAVLVNLLERDGRFDFRTDVEDRGREGIAVLEAAGLVNPLGAGAFHPHQPEEIPSSREHRYLASGEPVYRAMLLKRA